VPSVQRAHDPYPLLWREPNRLWRVQSLAQKGEGHLRSLAKEDLEALNLSKARHKAEDTSP